MRVMWHQWYGNVCSIAYIKRAHHHFYYSPQLTSTHLNSTEIRFCAILVDKSGCIK